MSPFTPRKCTARRHPQILLKDGPVLPVRVSISQASAQIRGEKPEVQTGALIDTGATTSCISVSLAAELSLISVSRGKFCGAHGDAELRNIYVVDFSFEGSGFWIRNCPVAEVDLQGAKFGMLVGRDLLRNAHLTYDGPTGEFTLEIPSPSHPSREHEKLEEEPQVEGKTAQSPRNRAERRRMEPPARKKKKS